ncbi:transcription termination factor Rho [Glycomyces salinus]|uniref:transcription termination factor Rho n=1 Tax=Glycomyces salinus TaxID=980294 RepID=UPI0022B8AFB3|nr:transcription termination factor Rho [Glycomyces salinus]
MASLLMPELQQMAQSLGITGVGRMRKSELIAAIQEKQGGGPGTGGASAEQEAPPVPDSEQSSNTETEAVVQEAPAPEPADSAASESVSATRRATRPAGPPQPRRRSDDRDQAKDTGSEDAKGPEARDDKSNGSEEPAPVRRRRVRGEGRAEQVETESGETDKPAEKRGDQRDQQRDQQREQPRDQQRDQQGEGNGRRRKRRDRSDRRRSNNRGDDVERSGNQNDESLVPVAGILDILDNYAFIRTTGYLAGPDDVYVSMSQVRKYRLRRGDAITGAVKPGRGEEGNGGGGGGKRREKYNPLVRLDTVNGMSPDDAKSRDEFYKLTPLYPQERLRLETEPNKLTTRVVDLVAPIGKGQRALIVSPPKAGKTMVLQAIANAITTNNPECHLMVVLADERPEEVTDMQRSVKGEVIASTFDRPPSDHTTVAELAIERAKRLVELGHDVVVLLDSITRLGRAYNNASPASGRILSGGIDSTALYPPKRFLGAARNIEHGGSLTIIATALVETGSMGDTVIFEEFKGTGNAELKLDRKIAEKRTWPAIDVHQSSTRKDELMMSSEEQAVMLKLRRVLAGLESQQAIEVLLDRLKKTQTNAEFLMSIVKQTAPGGE